MAQLLVIGSGGGGGVGTDHFAPRYIVGNSLAPYFDPIVAQASPFAYFPDPGDGSGIAAAFVAAAAVPGDVWIRPGTYTLTAGPLTVPPNVTVRGSGASTTVITGTSSGDQGVFVLSANAALRDLSIVSPAPTGPTVGSTAVVRCLGFCSISDIGLTLAPETGSTIEDGILYEEPVAGPFPVSTLNNAIFGMLGNGSSLSRAIHLLNTRGQGPTVVATTIQIFGAQAGFTTCVRVNNSAIILKQMIAFGYTDYGVEHIGPSGNIRMEESVLLTSLGGLNLVGISLQGGAHVVKSVAIQNFGLAGGIGIRLVELGASVNVCQIEDCLINAFDDGIVGGSLAGPGSSFFANSIVDSNISVNRRGIWLSGPVCSGNHILNNDVNVFQNGSATPLAGILIEEDPNPQQGGASRNFIKGNSVNVQLPLSTPTVHGIDIASQLSVVEGNAVVISLGGYDIFIREGCERVTVTGNICEAGGSANSDPLGCIYIAPRSLIAPFPSTVRSVINGNSCTVNYSVNPAPGTNTAIVCESEKTVVSNNAVFVASPGGSTPGIVFTAASTQCNCIGNICEGSGGIAVTDLGALNNVAQNIGA